MSESKGKDSVLLLNEINPENATFEECVKIISTFKSSKFCKRTGKLFEENENSPEVDYSHEINELKKQIEKQKKKISDFEINEVFHQKDIYSIYGVF